MSMFLWSFEMGGLLMTHSYVPAKLPVQWWTNTLHNTLYKTHPHRLTNT